VVFAGRVGSSSPVPRGDSVPGTRLGVGGGRGRPGPPLRRPRGAASFSRRAAGCLAVLALAGVGGCTAEAKAPETTPPFAGCSAMVAPPSNATTTISDLPDLRLPCFAGDTTVVLRELRGPAVINLWASWCTPCRRELPVMQRLADRAGGRLAVLGVDTGDGRADGASFADAKGITMPTLFDQDRKLLSAVAGTALPITIFLNGDGRSYVNRLPLDEASLPGLVRKYTGVTVPP
jgi:cytochrome c biogenesis protein CcmG/thiol:disulfide interchange protein DsbE